MQSRFVCPRPHRKRRRESGESREVCKGQKGTAGKKVVGGREEGILMGWEVVGGEKGVEGRRGEVIGVCAQAGNG